MPESVTLYEEKIAFHPVITVIYVALIGFLIWAAMGEPGPPFLLLIVSAILITIPLIFGRLVIRVDEGMLHITFGLIGWPAQHIPLPEISKIKIVDYRPIVNFGGWGIRRGRLEGELTSAYTVQGNRGVLLILSKERRICGIKTNRFLVSSKQPERLAAAIGK